MLDNPRATMKIVQIFFTQGLQPRCVRDLMDREKNISSFSALKSRFEIVMQRIRTAHMENPTVKPPNNNNNNNNNNRGRGNNPPRFSFVPTPALPAPSALGNNSPRPGPPVIPSPRPQYPNRSQAAGGARVNAISTRSLSPPPSSDDSLSH